MAEFAKTYKLPQPQPRYDLENENRFRRTLQGALDEISSAVGDLDLHETVITQIGKAGGVRMPLPRPTSNFPEETYYPAVFATALSTGTPGINKFQFIPFIVSQFTRLDRIALEVTAQVPNGVARVGLYNANQVTYKPTTLIVDSGEFITSSTGLKTANIDVSLVPGTVYCTAYVAGTGQHQTRTFQPTNGWPGLGWFNSGGNLFTRFGWVKNATYGALAADESATSLASLEGGDVPVVVFVRINTVD